MLFALGAASSAIDALKGADFLEVVLDPIDRSHPERWKPVRTSASAATATSAGPSTPLAGSGASQIVAGDDERAAGGAEPVFDRLDDVSIGEAPRMR